MASTRCLSVIYLLMILLAVPMYAEAIDIGALTEVGLQTHAMNRRLLQTIESVNPDCNAACGERCKEASRQNVCLRACGTCCAKCNCVPPGTYGNQDLCACYASMKTHDNKPKCP